MQLKKNKKKETNKKTPSSQSFHFLRLAYKDKEKFFFFLYSWVHSSLLQ